MPQSAARHREIQGETDKNMLLRKHSGYSAEAI